MCFEGSCLCFYALMLRVVGRQGRQQRLCCIRRGRSLRNQSGGPEYVDARKFKGGDSGVGTRGLVLVGFAAASAALTHQYYNRDGSTKIPAEDIVAPQKSLSDEPKVSGAVSEVQADTAQQIAKEDSVFEKTKALIEDKGASDTQLEETTVDVATITEPEAQPEPEPEPEPQPQPQPPLNATDPSVDEVISATAPPTATEEDASKVAFDVADVKLPMVAAEKSADDMHKSVSAASVEEIVMQIAGTHSELEDSLLGDVGNADEQTLRVRIAQMTAELLERAKWEGIRTTQATRKLSADVSERYAALMMQQRRELEVEAARMSAEVERQLLQRHATELARLRAEMEAETAKALGEQATSLNTAALQTRQRMQMELAEQINQVLADEVASVRQTDTVSQLDALKTTYSKLHELRDKVTTAGPMGGVESGIANVRAHRRLGAVLDMEKALGEGDRLAGHMATLRDAFLGDPMAESVLAELPTAFRNPTFNSLKMNFPALRDEVIKASLAPAEAPPMVGNAIGSVLSAFTKKRVGMVSGNAPEEVLARASFHLDMGDLVAAVREVESLEGRPREVMSDWVNSARSRLVCDQALSALKSRSTV